MALQSCHECGHQVSTEAAACPSCGAPAKPAAPLPSKPHVATFMGPGWSTPDNSVPGWVKGVGWIASSIFGLVIVVSIVAAVYGTNPTPHKPEFEVVNRSLPADRNTPMKAHFLAQAAVEQYASSLGLTVPQLADKIGGVRLPPDQFVSLTAVMLETNPTMSAAQAARETRQMIETMGRLAGDR